MSDETPTRENTANLPENSQISAAAAPRPTQVDETSRGVTRWIMLAIFAWGCVAAAGVARYDYQRDQFNVVKPLVIVVVTLAALALWSIAIARRAARR